jgi:hypothetical protein
LEVFSKALHDRNDPGEQFRAITLLHITHPPLTPSLSPSQSPTHSAPSSPAHKSTSTPCKVPRSAPTSPTTRP